MLFSIPSLGSIVLTIAAGCRRCASFGPSVEAFVLPVCRGIRFAWGQGGRAIKKFQLDKKTQRVSVPLFLSLWVSNSSLSIGWVSSNAKVPGCRQRGFERLEKPHRGHHKAPENKSLVFASKMFKPWLGILWSCSLLVHPYHRKNMENDENIQTIPYQKSFLPSYLATFTLPASLVSVTFLSDF